MQKNTLQFSLRLRSVFLAGLALLVLASTAFASPSSAQALQKILQRFQVQQGSLSSALKQLESKAQISLAYDEAALQKIQVHANTYQKKTVISILQDLLSQSSLKFEEKYNTVLIYDSASLAAMNTLQATAEKITLTGAVYDNNGPLIGATVMIKGTTIGTGTDASGHFKLSATASDNLVLVVSMIGFKTQEIAVGSQRSFQIVLVENSLNLNQLVVVGYGTQRKATVSGAVADVQLDKLTSRSLNNAAEALQGKAPGVIIQNNGGDPTSNPTVYVRGMGGINGESALYIVDGSIYNGGPINPNDIESINVLKDASAAIYGARASGGVILITTKKGKEGTATVTLDAKTGWQYAAKKLDVLNAKQFADVENIAYTAAGIAPADAFNATKYPDGQVTRTDWQDEIFRTGKIQDYNVGVKGGTDKSRYYMGFGYRRNEGILLNTHAERYSFRMNSDAQIKPWLKIGENLSFTYNNGNGANTTSPYTGAIFTALGYPRNITPYTSTGAFSGMPSAYAGSYGDLANPVAILSRMDNKTPVSNININPYVEVKLTKDLLFRSNFSVTKSFSDQKNFTTRALEIGKINTSNGLIENIKNGTNILSEQTLTYTKQFAGVHNITAVAGYTYQHDDNTFLYLSAGNFGDEKDVYRYFDNAGTWDKPSSGRSQTAMEAILGRINYDYKGKYLLTVLGRRDGSSLVAPQNHYQNYYSVSGGWVLTEEDFLRKNDVLSFMKLRASYGVLGNLGSLPANAINVNMKSVNIYTGSNGAQTTGLAEDALSNPNLTWADSRQLNFGADLAFFKNSLSINADYFIKTTENMILQLDPPSTAGVSTGMYKNMGKARDAGFELGINYNGKIGKDFTFGVGATATAIKNKLLELEEGRNEVVSSSNINVRSTLNPIVTRVGHQIYAYNVIRTDGIFQTQEEINNYVNKDGALIQPNAKPGDRKFIDQPDKNGVRDGVINNNDRQIVGSPFPDFSYGLSLNASYKGFDLNVFAQGVQGNKLFNALKFTSMNPSVGNNYNMLSGILNAWTPQHTNTDVTRIISTDKNGNYGNTSDWYIENGSYLRIKNITLGYTLPANLTNQAHIGAVRLYVTATNLFTITKYTGYDPEVGMDELGIDKGRYPQAKNVLIGLNVNF
ncbi:SusC/RagA family TonB-linked outer membrane protein [Chitinophaga ginsengisoli]|uniref:TonB-linked SusC/RagA family outer membrane protein n=1 Tax=Chitinophaga ginsengisoli TaxID=363837 RepID=A0A2P8GHV1_9BACT|nr:TonB-dependent receptor [Chitinophaga ginsengisoli]PSL33517.1 TonB-linked SusC/RagA family outer membrane protein [Chitinophaga ginsengisoli]